MINWSNEQPMVLKKYWQIIWKRAWIPLLLVAVVAVVTLLTRQTTPPTYSTTMRFTIGVKPQEVVDQYNYDSYYAWVASEYMADDMTVIVESQAFANDINARLAELGSEVRIPPGIRNGWRILPVRLRKRWHFQRARLRGLKWPGSSMMSGKYPFPPKF